MSEKFPAVAVLTDRPSSNGRAVKGLAGEAVILNDEPNYAYITGKGWYGSWPLDETSIPAIREEAQRKEAAALAAATANLSQSFASTAIAFDRLTESLKQTGVPEDVTTGYLLKRDGTYLRLPSLGEFSKSFDDLDKAGKVAP